MKTKSKGKNSPTPPLEPMDQRLQKVLAAAGLGSRRKCEELILQGRVEIDGQIVQKLGAKVNPRRSIIRVDGETVKTKSKVYFMLHKPRGVLATNSDPSGRTRVIDLVPDHERLFTVGRLDKSSEGLILLTNDGEWANQLMHPRFGVKKVYEAQVAGAIDRETLAILRRGIHLAEGFARIDHARIKSRRKQSTIVEITLHEGKNREIRRLLAKVGHKVQRLKRVAIGPLRLGDLQPGEFRALRGSEQRKLANFKRPSAKKRPRYVTSARK